MKRTQWLPTAADTARLGAALAQCCPWDEPGTRVLFLLGDLGAGKTTLAAAMLDSLGAHEIARSPSYTLVEPYELSAGLALHIDCYRLRDVDELELLGLRDYLRDRTLWLLEWPERVASALPAPDLCVRLELAGEGRSVELKAQGAVGEAWLSELK